VALDRVLDIVVSITDLFTDSFGSVDVNAILDTINSILNLITDVAGSFIDSVVSLVG